MSDFFYPAQRVVYEDYPQEGGHLQIVRLRRSLATMIDVDRYIDPLKTSCDAFAYTDKGVHLFWVAPNGRLPSRLPIKKADSNHSTHRLNLGRVQSSPVFRCHTGRLRTRSRIQQTRKCLRPA